MFVNISLYLCVGADMASFFFFFQVIICWHLKGKRWERAEPKGKAEARAATVHKHSHGASETPRNTLDPCSPAHITAHCPACCNFDGQKSYYFDPVWGNWSNECVRCAGRSGCCSGKGGDTLKLPALRFSPLMANFREPHGLVKE